MSSENVEPSEGKAPNNASPKALKNTGSSTKVFRRVVAAAGALMRALDEAINGPIVLGQALLYPYLQETCLR